MSSYPDGGYRNHMGASHWLLLLWTLGETEPSEVYFSGCQLFWIIRRRWSWTYYHLSLTPPDCSKTVFLINVTKWPQSRKTVPLKAILSTLTSKKKCPEKVCKTVARGTQMLITFLMSQGGGDHSKGKNEVHYQEAVRARMWGWYHSWYVRLHYLHI